MSYNYYGGHSENYAKKDHHQHQVTIKHGKITENFLQNQKAYINNSIRKELENLISDPPEDSYSQKQKKRKVIMVSYEFQKPKFNNLVCALEKILDGQDMQQLTWGRH